MQTVLLEFLELIGSLALLVFAADYLVKSASKLAHAIGISSTVIGLTLISFGTSFPEFAVSSFASFKGSSDIAVSNIIGSNIYNIAVIIGITALLSTIIIKKDNICRIDNYTMLAGTLLLVPLFLIGGISRFAGLVMAVALVACTYYAVRHHKSHVYAKKPINSVIEIELVIIMIASLLGVVFAGNILVDSATALAKLFGVSSWLIGATIIAAGTSFPETAVSIIAAHRKELGISIGNIVGSNIFNVFWILGIAGMIKPLALDFARNYIDLGFLLLITVLFSLGLFKKRITKIEGVVYILIYIAYIYYLISPNL